MTNEQLNGQSAPAAPVLRDGVPSRDSSRREKAHDFVTQCGREFHFANVDADCQQMIEKISGEKCLRCNGYTLFENFPNFLEEFLDLEVRDDDVWVCSFPRSGE